MIDFHEEFVTALNMVLPTYYEMSLHKGIITPCISYMELNNSADMEGNTIGYSRISYQVKIWATDIAIIQKYALEVDIALRPLGFRRISSGELYDNSSAMIQKIMTYEALAIEDF